MSTQYLPTPLHAFFYWEKHTPDNTFLRQPVQGKWIEWSYKSAGNEVRKIAYALAALNFPQGSNIAILSKNCAHWIMADLAIMMSGHVSVPIYPTLSASGVRQILEHSESRAIFIGKLDDYESQRVGIDSQIKKLSFPLYGIREGIQWDDALKKFQPKLSDVSPSPDQLATIMYSSGTTGTPKGVMLTFGAFGYVGEEVKKHLNITKPQRYFSYLPLSHIAERSLMEMVALNTGSAISFAESLDTFQQNLVEVSPTIFGGVPRIFSKFQEGVLKKMPQAKLDRLLSIPFVSTLVKRAIQKKLGLSKANVIVCGAAPTPVSLLDWFQKLGIQIRETYGMTENTAYSHSNYRTIKNGTVGQAWPGIQVRCDEAGEVLIRHPAVMKGYFKDAETTNSVFTDDGFLKTGDQGFIDDDGFLTITGRVKDQFKTDKAKFIAPAPIETKFMSNTFIEQVCVVGQGLPQPIALIILSSVAREKPKPSLEQELMQTLHQVNESLESYERVKLAVILNDAWTIENGMMTPSLKVKRNVVEAKFTPMYLQWYRKEESVIWE